MKWVRINESWYESDMFGDGYEVAGMRTGCALRVDDGRLLGSRSPSTREPANVLGGVRKSAREGSERALSRLRPKQNPRD